MDWQPIETAPKDGRPILVYCDAWYESRLVAGWDAHEKAWRIKGMGCPFAQPSHWHQLPEPPK